MYKGQIAVDATSSKRTNGETLDEFFAQIKAKYPEQPLMADCSTLEEMLYADRLGFDYIGTTLVGYTSQSKGCFLYTSDAADELDR